MSPNLKFNIAIIILAAGASTRMGQPKQLLTWQGETLIRRMVKMALATQCSTFVVLGANATFIHPEISDFDIKIVENEDWEKGMSTTMRVGLQALLKAQPNVQAALFLLTDQPFVTTDYLVQLIDCFQRGGKREGRGETKEEGRETSHQQPATSIIASAYEGRLGVPAIFGRAWFEELMQIEGDRGARALLMQHQEEVLAIPFPAGKFDLDTPEDFDNLITNS